MAVRRWHRRVEVDAAAVAGTVDATAGGGTAEVVAAAEARTAGDDDAPTPVATRGDEPTGAICFDSAVISALICFQSAALGSAGLEATALSTASRSDSSVAKAVDAPLRSPAASARLSACASPAKIATAPTVAFDLASLRALRPVSIAKAPSLIRAAAAAGIFGARNASALNDRERHHADDNRAGADYSRE